MPTSHRFSLARIAGATGLCLSLAAPLGAQTLVVDPAEALVDGPLSVRVSGLSAGQAFIVRSEAKDADGRIWQAWAGYLANGAGEGDVSSEPPRHGSFTTAGAGSQGLLTSMDLAGESRGRARFSWPGSEPIEIRLTLEIGGRAASTATAIRRFRAPEGRVVELREEGLVGRLFLPDGAGPFPGVLVLGGSEGKLSSEPLAALLAARGFAALALAYFGLPDLPSSLQEIPLEYFDRAIEWMLRHPAVRRPGIAIVGTSKGAEAGLLVAAGSRRVVAVVAYAPSAVAWSCICAEPERPSWTRAGKAVPYVGPGTDPTYAPPKGFPIEPAVHYSWRLQSSRASEVAAIRVEAIAGPLLLVWGRDDRLWPSAESARRIRVRLDRRGHPRSEFLEYADAGHLIGLPNLPAGSTIVGGRLETGGTPAGNAWASQDAWPRVLRFLSAAPD